jgi:hypothetical protein
MVALVVVDWMRLMVGYRGRLLLALLWYKSVQQTFVYRSWTQREEETAKRGKPDVRMG